MSVRDFKAIKPAVPSGVPIVGQAFAIKGGYPTVLLQCNCGAHEPMLLIGNQPSACPACRRGFVTTAFAFDAQTGQIQVQIGQVRQHEPAAEPTGAPA